MDVQHWGVDIRVNCERVLTIESTCLSGIDDIAKFREVIQGCAHHLLAFIGDGKPDASMELGTTPNTGSPKSAPELVEGEICDYCINQADVGKCRFCPDHNFESFVGRRLRAGA